MKNKNCKFYPCHKELEDCTLCYCPIYPCYIEGTGGKKVKKVWDCSDCNYIHDLSIVYQIKTYITHLINVKVRQNETN